MINEEIVIVDGLKYLRFRGELIPILDENGNYEKAEHRERVYDSMKRMDIKHYNTLKALDDL